jgi:hypothetical protein
MTDAEADRPCLVCGAPIAATQVFVRAADDRLHVECFFIRKAEGKLPAPSPSRPRPGS